MQIVAAACTQHELPLLAPWHSAAGKVTARSIRLLTLHTDSGLAGYGECAPLVSHGSEDFATATRALGRWCRDAGGRTPAALLAALPAADDCPAPAARSAIECALLDLQAQAAGLPLAQMLAPAAATGVAVNAMGGTLAADAPAGILALAAAGFRVIKLKLGVAGCDAEMAALQALCGQLPDAVRLHLDVNGAWDEATARRCCALAKDLPIESLEEPLHARTLAALRTLQEACAFPLAVDESWSTLDHEAFLAAPPVRRLTLKLAALGGPLPALALAKRARAAGIDCVVTTGIDGACATLAAAHLAAALDNGLAHGLATSAWLERDIGSAPAVADGRLQLPSIPGIGFSPAPAAIR